MARQEAHRLGGRAAASALCGHFTRALEGSFGDVADATMAGYWPKGDELDVRPLLDVLAGVGRVLALPRMDVADAPLAFHRWRPGDALIEGRYGIMEPEITRPPVVPRIVMVPLLAFDAAGYRLGYGSGYYDRSLGALREAGPVVAVGIGFACQRVTDITHHAGDARLDWMITEDGIVEFD